MANARPTYPILAIDASSRTTWVGLKPAPDELVCRFSADDPSQSLFTLTAALLEQSGTPLSELGSIVFCEGPGSMLGTRTAVMCLRTWRGIGIPAAGHLFAYNSLALGRQRVAENRPGAEPTLIVTDARRDSWHCLEWPATAAGDSVYLLNNGDLENDPRRAYTFPQFARWTQSAKALREIDYDPQPTFAGEAFLEIARPVDQASPLTLRANDFKKWTPKFHAAPPQ